MKKRPRRVGFGMKPREGVELSAVAGQNEVAVSGDLSATVGQEEVPEEGVSEGVAGESEGGDLQSEALQNLESEEVGEAAGGENEAIVAHLPTFEPLPAVPKEAFDTLADLMKQSEAATGAALYIPTPAEESGIPVDQIGLEPTTWPTYGGIQRAPMPTIADMERAMEDDAKVEIEPDGTVKITAPVFCGELPTGEYRATVRVPEGYIEGIKAQAEADNQSLEDWLTAQLQERLEQWFFAAGSR